MSNSLKRNDPDQESKATTAAFESIEWQALTSTVIAEYPTQGPEQKKLLVSVKGGDHQSEGLLHEASKSSREYLERTVSIVLYKWALRQI